MYPEPDATERRSSRTRFQGRGYPGGRGSAFSPEPWKPPGLKPPPPFGPEPPQYEPPGNQPRDNPYDPKWRRDPKWPGGRRPYWPSPRPSPFPKVPWKPRIPGSPLFKFFRRNPWFRFGFEIYDLLEPEPLRGEIPGGYIPGWVQDFTCQTMELGPTGWKQGPFDAQGYGTCGVVTGSPTSYLPYDGGDTMSPVVERFSGIPRKWWNLGRWSRPQGSTTPPVWTYPPRPNAPPLLRPPSPYLPPPTWLDPFTPPGGFQPKPRPPPFAWPPSRPKPKTPPGDGTDFGNDLPRGYPPPPPNRPPPNPPEPPRPRPPPPGTKDKKTYGALKKGILDTWDAATETDDAANCLIDQFKNGNDRLKALLRRAKNKPGKFNKYQFLWENWDEIDAAMGLICMLNSNYKDRFAGYANRALKRKGIGSGFGGTPYRRTLPGGQGTR